jgi:predicted amidohydrolase
MKRYRIRFFNPKKAKRQLHVAATAVSCVRDPKINRARIARTVEKVIQQHPETELIVFGEMILGWYDPAGSTDYHHQISESLPGETSEVFGKLSSRYKIFLSYGFSELAGGKFYNTQVLLNPQGRIQAAHRKWNLKAAERNAGYLPGANPVTVTEINGIKTGMIICSDAAHPVTMRTLMRKRLDLILYSLADDQDEKWFMAKANARLYDAWIVSANRYGYENDYWNGHTIISDPLGNLRVTMLDQEGFAAYTLLFMEDRSSLHRTVSSTLVKIPLIWHLLRHWRILRSYYR